MSDDLCERAMPNGIRNYVAKKLADAVQCVSRTAPQELPHLAWCIRFAGVSKKTPIGSPQLAVNYKDLQACKALKHSSQEERHRWATSVAEKLTCDNVIESVQAHNNALHIKVNSHELTQDVLWSIVKEKHSYGQLSVLHKHKPDPDGLLQSVPQGETVLVEYSSPNIAKPFHAGHLRSTIIGNFVANINKALSHNVMRVNYLGDWGTQFGLLSVGYQKYALESEMKSDAMRHLFSVYVKISQDAEGVNGQEVRKEGMEFFRKMEAGDPSCLALWQYCRDKSIQEYTKVYERLGVTFDEYEGESQYQGACNNLVADLQEQGLLQYQDDPPVGYIDLSSPQHPSLHATLVKSDGTTLYLTRDVAAAISRYQRFKCDRFHYVVENGQHQHFIKLLNVLKHMGHDWAMKRADQWHIKFGRVEGMSTRRGHVVFLDDILDEARDRMKENMEKTKTTKVQNNFDKVADDLGVSAIIVQDLKEPRLRNYKFSWQRALTFDGDTGVSLQYAHARLCSLERACGIPLNFECPLNSLTESSAVNLTRHLARYDQCLNQAFTVLEPCHVVGYLFTLCHLVNVANTELRVKGEGKEVAEARLLLFHCAKNVLANGLQLLGITPLKMM